MSPKPGAFDCNSVSNSVMVRVRVRVGVWVWVWVWVWVRVRVRVRPGALMAATLTPPRSLLTTRVARASPG